MRKLPKNKKIPETDYPRGSPDSYRDIEVFRRPDNYRDYILPLPELRKGNPDLPKGEVNSETPR